ncbi:TraB/GumN family protein [Aurantiacibacter suaedae]|uniref:TraB/GumN family protein n=1 Tax=Aurantiacibacter suaedae TaxID=2545755 RepID=UPI001386B4F3|nr:TraB/GumN family protein [Aurantiacibacter suaedae]
MIRALLSALLLAFGLAACDLLESEPERIAPGDPAPALWEVTAQGGQKAWLFGTIHALPDDARWHSAALDNAFDESGLLVVEIADLGDAQAATEAFASLAYTPGLGPFRARQDRAFNQRLDGKIGDNDAILPPDIEDWAAALRIASASAEDRGENGVDRALLAGSKPVVGLESYVAQFGIFDALSPADQKALLRAVMDDDSAKDEAAMRAAWLSGDLEALSHLAMTGMLTEPGLRAALLEQRNQAWAGQIAPLIQEGRKPFVAVGAAHMLGEQGLPALLEARGMRVSRIQ